MGRRERPLDPAAGPVAAFAVELRMLREKAGSLPYRAMAAQVHFSAATLAAAAAGEKLPTLPVTLAYVAACGGDGRQWRARWEETCAAAREAASAAASAPYRGLARFETADQAYFFGRSALLDRLVTLVRAHRFVMVVGPSGCGKSSLLRAGLAPSLQPSAVRVLTPGTHPDLTAASGGEVIVVDQFEETFTLCQDPAERQAFIDALVTIGHDSEDTRVVLAVRADFFGHCARYPELIEAIRDATVPVGPMSPAELREAIIKPAAAAGLIVQRELTARIVEEVTGQPGGLPLMSHALLETWRRRHGKALTMAAYESAGGIDGAVTHTAEDLYADLTPAQQERLRHLLLRMITPGEAGAHDTRRPVGRAELSPGDSGALLLERLAAARLITLDDDTADLAHEALLTAWPRLRSWVEESREHLRVHRHLTEAATAWEDHARDPGTLYRGLRLAVAREYLAGRVEALTPHERAFLEASTAAHHGARRRGRVRTFFISVLVTLALMAASLAWQQSAANSRQEREAHVRRMIGTAESLRRSDPRLAMRLSLAAWQLADLPETRAALRTASLQPEQDSFTDPDVAPATQRWLSADGRSLLSLGASRVTRWDLDSRRVISTAPGPAARMPKVAKGAGDARRLPMLGRSGDDPAVTLWDVETGRHDPTPLDTANQGAEVTPSGHVITYHAHGSSYRVRVWDSSTLRPILHVSTPRKASGRKRSESVSALAVARSRGAQLPEVGAPDATISADGKTLALCVPGRPLQLWNLDGGHRMKALWAPTLSFEQCRDEQLVLAPDGRRLLTIAGARIRLWQLPEGKETPALNAADVYEAAFSQDGAFLATAGTDELLVWRMSHLDAPVFRYPLGGELALDLRIDPAGNRIRYIAGAVSSQVSATLTTVRTLQLTAVFTSGWRDEHAHQATFSPDGRKLATLYRNRIELRDSTTGQRLPDPPPLPCPTPTALPESPGCRAIAAFRPDSRALAYGDGISSPFTAKVWDLDRLRLSGASPSLRRGHSLAFTGKGTKLLVSGIHVFGDDASPLSKLDIVDLRTGSVSAVMPGIIGNFIAVDPAERLLATSLGQVADLSSGVPVLRQGGIGVANQLAFSPGGRFLAVSKGDGRTDLWDGQVQRHLGTLTPTSAGGYAGALAFSRDANTLAVGMGNGTIQLWDTATRQPSGAPIAMSGGGVRALALHGDTLYAAGEHIPLQRYDLTPAAAAVAVCRRAGDGLTPGDWTTYFAGYPYQPACG
ncbi:hypothetical protein [Nonomuraea typhae]|uniref:Novel STAND NTPase 1 domain-containing protein n=1 Tax=Nonomuraea typhae TaxID=2603600 RepID=A0ABW7ZAZ9_9ACTN